MIFFLFVCFLANFTRRSHLCNFGKNKSRILYRDLQSFLHILPHYICSKVFFRLFSVIFQTFFCDAVENCAHTLYRSVISMPGSLIRKTFYYQTPAAIDNILSSKENILPKHRTTLWVFQTPFFLRASMFSNEPFMYTKGL